MKQANILIFVLRSYSISHDDIHQSFGHSAEKKKFLDYGSDYEKLWAYFLSSFCAKTTKNSETKPIENTKKSGNSSSWRCILCKNHEGKRARKLDVHVNLQREVSDQKCAFLTLILFRIEIPMLSRLQGWFNSSSLRCEEWSRRRLYVSSRPKEG